jgi:hypothetical protein
MPFDLQMLRATTKITPIIIIYLNIWLADSMPCPHTGQTYSFPRSTVLVAELTILDLQFGHWIAEFFMAYNAYNNGKNRVLCNEVAARIFPSERSE